MKKILAALLLCLPFVVHAQGFRDGLPLRGNGQSGTSLPSACGTGTLFFKTDATAGLNIYLCTATNTWTQQAGGSIAVGSITGLGTGVGTWLATPSSSNLASALTDETGSGAAVFGTAPTISNPVITGSAITFTTGTSRTLANASEIVVCTGTCTVTPPASATAGMQFCVQNDDNIATVITLAAVSGVQWEATARTSYGTANHTMTSGGAVKDQACFVAVSSTKWNNFSSSGTWTNN